MRTAVAREIESDHQDDEDRQSVGLHIADAKRQEREPHSIDATQGRQIGSHPDDDATQGRQIGSRPTDDATAAGH